jgi:hypothetical protein
LGRGSGAQLVATDVAAGHVSNKSIALPVLSFTDRRPWRVGVDDGKGVWILSATSVVQSSAQRRAYSERWPQRRRQQ